MSTYVDGLKAVGSIKAGCFGRRAKYACHLMADTDRELEAMRKALALRSSWRHHDHYDLTSGKRFQAVRLGAVEVSSVFLVRLRMKQRGRKK